MLCSGSSAAAGAYRSSTVGRPGWPPALAAAEPSSRGTGVRLYVDEYGDGPAVVLLHGLMATGDMFGGLVPPLSARYRLIVPDLPGHGHSAGVSGPYTVDAMA